jgi:hypothetical protein
VDKDEPARVAREISPGGIGVARCIAKPRPSRPPGGAFAESAPPRVCGRLGGLAGELGRGEEMMGQSTLLSVTGAGGTEMGPKKLIA